MHIFWWLFLSWAWPFTNILQTTFYIFILIPHISFIQNILCKDEKRTFHRLFFSFFTDSQTATTFSLSPFHQIFFAFSKKISKSTGYSRKLNPCQILFSFSCSLPVFCSMKGKPCFRTAFVGRNWKIEPQPDPIFSTFGHNQWQLIHTPTRTFY